MSINPCHLCHWCSTDNQFLVKIGGFCTKPREDGDAAIRRKVAYDVRNNTNLCNFGLWFEGRGTVVIPDNNKYSHDGIKFRRKPTTTRLDRRVGNV